jgi:lysyl endopeptidase
MTTGDSSIRPTRRKTILSAILLLSCHLFLSAQIKHGYGRPSLPGIEKNTKLGTSVDYFVEMPDLDTDSARFVDDLPGNRIGGLRFAHTFFTNISPENSGVNFTDEQGNRIWKVGIRSNGAYSLNVVFDRFELPDSGKIFLYNTDRSVVLGPFTNKNRSQSGEFMAAPVAGDELIVEYQEQSSGSFSGQIHLSEVKHDYRGLMTRSSPMYNPSSLPCIPDASCNTLLDTLKQSTCLIIVNGDTYCTGTFINNTAKDGKPYLLTASHCLKNNWDYGGRIVAFLNYESPHCDRRLGGSEEFSLSGSVCRSLNSEYDFALIEFQEKPPVDYRLYLSGWSRDPEAKQNAPFYCIQHPNGDTKKYCLEEDALAIGDGDTLNLANDENWYIRYWELGHTWSGSSGSGLFDKNNRLIGIMLRGGSGGLTGCNPYTTGDYFARMDQCWAPDPESSKQLKCWLDPLTGSSQDSPYYKLDGLNPNSNNPAKRISNITPQDSLNRLPFSNGWGTLIGHNSLEIKHYAESFQVADSSLLLGAYLMIAKGKNSEDNPIYLTVYNDNEGQPGDLIKRERIDPSYQSYSEDGFEQKSKSYLSNRECYVRLPNPVKIGKDFHVGFEISYPIKTATDSFIVYGAVRNNTVNTAFFLNNRTWFPFTQYPFSPVYTSIWIEPVIIRDTIQSQTNDSTSTASEHPTIIWSRIYQRLEIHFPSQWSGETTIEIIDLYGKTILKSNILPPKVLLDLHLSAYQMYLVKLSNQQFRYVQKIMAGYD